MRGQRARRTGPTRPGIRPLGLPVLACTALCVLIARPAYADPPPAGPPTTPSPTISATPGSGPTGPVPPLTIPDGGVVPVPSSPLADPAATAPATAGPPPADTSVTGPFASQILADYANAEAIGEKLNQIDLDVAAARNTVKTMHDLWQAQQAQVNDLQRKADGAAAKAYKDAAGLGPFGAYATDVHQLGMLAPALGDGSRGGPAGSESAAQEAAQARQLASIEEQAYQSAQAKLQQMEAQQADLHAQYDQLNAKLTELRTVNQALVAQAETAQEQVDRGLAPMFRPGSMVGGKAANPLALAAVAYAYAQYGKPYWWAHEGPDYFDCSGLVWAAYKSTGYLLPRVANDQYHATTPISADQLLPGDLVFFSVTSRTDWTTISHVGMYVGDGLMIEAPRTGETVTVTTVWWSAFFGATRIYPAVDQAPAGPAPVQLPPVVPPVVTGPTNPAPTTPAAPPATPTGPPDPSATPTPSGSVTPTPSASATPSGSATPTPSGSATPSPSPSPSPSPLPSPTGSASAAPSGAASSSAAPSAAAPASPTSSTGA
jgi:peptidoglycan DL-endopeptidase CwlO